MHEVAFQHHTETEDVSNFNNVVQMNNSSAIYVVNVHIEECVLSLDSL